MDCESNGLNALKTSFRSNCNPTGIYELATKETLTVYPNPATNLIEWAYNEDVTNVTVRLYDLSDHELQRPSNTQLDVSNLAAGIYALKGIIKNKLYTTRLVIL